MRKQRTKGPSSGGHSDTIGDYSGVFSAVVPKGGDSDSLYIRFHFVCKSARIDTIYQYRWVDTTPAVTGEKESGHISGGTEKEDKPEESPAREETEDTGTEEEATEKTEPIVQTVTQRADAEYGEVSGVGIIPAIILGLGGALAAAGMLGVSTHKGRNGDENGKQKSFRMKVYKSFGDGIRRGAKPVTVWARIVEVIDGEEINCPELSEKITASGTGMDVRSVGVQNTYMGAEVSVPADSGAQTATLTFTYAGEGGVFRNNIVFQVLGEPEIVFPAVSEDGAHWGWVRSEEGEGQKVPEGRSDSDQLKPLPRSIGAGRGEAHRGPSSDRSL